MPKRKSEPKVMLNLRVTKYLRDALHRVARDRSAKLDRKITVRDVLLNNLSRDEDVIREMRRLKAASKKQKG